MKILIVEDNPDSRRLLKMRLEGAGYEVAEAEDGQVAWTLYQRDPFQIVITDWMMPNLDGPGLIQNIRSSGRKNYTYIVMLTAIDEKPKVVIGLESGADEYLTKPFDNKELLARVASGERVLKLEEDLMQAHRQMELLAAHDGLTGILNRRGIEERASVEFDHARQAESPLSVIILDIDHFKAINDKWGHSAGDEILRRTPEILANHLRERDYIGRWGGEEFLALLPNTKLADAIKVAERMRTLTAKTKFFVKEGERYKVQISLGVACTSDSYVSLEKFVDAADNALYQAKRAGRNRTYPILKNRF